LNENRSRNELWTRTKYVYDGFLPGRWPSPRLITVAGTPTIIFGTVEGVIFYTDKVQAAKDLAALSAADLTFTFVKGLFQGLLSSGPSSVDALGNVIQIAPKVPQAAAGALQVETGVAQTNALQGAA